MTGRILDLHPDPPAKPMDPGLREIFEYRDLGIKDGTHGDFVAHLIRHNGKKTKDEVQQWHVHDCTFQFVYVMNGWATFEYEGQGQRTIRKGDSILQVPASSTARSPARTISRCWRSCRRPTSPPASSKRRRQGAGRRIDVIPALVAWRSVVRLASAVADGWIPGTPAFAGAGKARDDTRRQNGLVTIPPSARRAAPLVALEAFEQT